MGRSSSFRQSSVLLSYGRSYGIRCRRRFEQHSHPQRPWLRRQQEQPDQFGTGEIGSQRSRRRLFWRLGLLSSANHNLFFFKNNKNFLDQRSLRRLSVEHGRVVQEPRSRHGQSQFAQFQHLPHDRRGEGVQERRAPLRRDQTQEQRLRWVFFFFSCLVPLWQFLFSLLRWLGYVDTSPQVSSWSTSSLCERLETDSRFVVFLFFLIVDEAYDRLDDSRPLTEVRPQYLRIASGSLGSLGGLAGASSHHSIFPGASVSASATSASAAGDQATTPLSLSVEDEASSSSSSSLSLSGSAKVWKKEKKSDSLSPFSSCRHQFF